jgi:hypothetical protein
MKTRCLLHVILLGICGISAFAQKASAATSSAEAPQIAPQAESGNPPWIVPAVFTKRAELADCTNGEVHVTILLETDQKSRAYLAAKLTPNPGCFISSKNLPEGFWGCRTFFTLVTTAMIQVKGPVFEDPPAREMLEEPDGVSSYYPAGTVTLRMAVGFTKVDSDVATQVRLGYSTSNGNVCTMPMCGPFDIKISAATLREAGIREAHP